MMDKGHGIFFLLVTFHLHTLFLFLYTSLTYEVKAITTLTENNMNFLHLHTKIYLVIVCLLRTKIQTTILLTHTKLIKIIKLEIGWFDLRKSSHSFFFKKVELFRFTCTGVFGCALKLIF